MKKWYTSRWYKHMIYYKRLREREIDIMGIAIAIVCLFVLYRKWNKKITKEIEEQRAKTQKLIDEVNKNINEIDCIIYEMEFTKMVTFLEEECCLGSLITDYYDLENPTMTEREYYESEMIKHGILDVYEQWKKLNNLD